MNLITNDPDKPYKIALTIYILQAAGLVFGLPFIIAVIMHYCVDKEPIKGTWLASHFQWQIRTFWYGLLWGLLGLISFWIFVGFIILILDLIWVIYRIAKGWIFLYERKPLYAK